MPAYNAAAFIEDAINSALKQTYTDFELIVINDCSTDNTEDIISRLAATDTRIRFYKNDNNSGVSFTRNFGISKALGKWVAFLDSDDMWREDKIQKQVNLLKVHPDVVISYTASSFIDHSGKPFNYIMSAKSEITYKMLLKRNLLSCSSVMVRKDVICKIGMAGDNMFKINLNMFHSTIYGVFEIFPDPNH